MRQPFEHVLNGGMTVPYKQAKACNAILRHYRSFRDYVGKQTVYMRCISLKEPRTFEWHLYGGVERAIASAIKKAPVNQGFVLN